MSREQKASARAPRCSRRRPGSPEVPAGADPAPAASRPGDPASRHRRRCALARGPGSRVPPGAGARAEQGFQFLARTSAVRKLHGELARCLETAAAAGPRAGVGAATRTGTAPVLAPARGPRCPAAAPRRSAGRPRSARAWRRQSRRIPGTRWWTRLAWRRRPTTACAARSAISTGRSSTPSNVRRRLGAARAGAAVQPAPGGRGGAAGRCRRRPGGAASRGRAFLFTKCAHARAVAAAARASWGQRVPHGQAGKAGGRTRSATRPSSAGQWGEDAEASALRCAQPVSARAARPAATPPEDCQKCTLSHPTPIHRIRDSGWARASAAWPANRPCC